MSDRELKIDYVEFNVIDIEKTKAFYGDVFGWTFTDYGPDYCEFNDGRMKGGFASGEPIKAGGALIVLYADDLETLIQKIEAHGGAITKPVFDFPGGQRFQFTDVNGHELAVWREI